MSAQALIRDGDTTHHDDAIQSRAIEVDATLIAAAGRASRTPPPLPREATRSPARARPLTSFCAVGPGMPVCSASRPA